MSTGDCSSCWSSVMGLGRVQLASYWTSDTSRDDSYRWQVCKDTGRSPTPIRINCAFWWTLTIPEDNATTHTSRIVTELFQEHTYEFRHYHCAPKFSDRNIIQHFWDALQRAVEKRSPLPCTPMDLWNDMQDSWCQWLSEGFQILIESMPHRVAALLHARVSPARY